MNLQSYNYNLWTVEGRETQRALDSYERILDRFAGLGIMAIAVVLGTALVVSLWLLLETLATTL